jgi:prevent-host-death family protein
MEVVGIKELKNNLSRYLREVKAGEELLVSERGRVVARIIPAGKGKSSEVEELYDLARRGLVRLPEVPLEPVPPDMVEIRGKPLSETVIEERR